MNRSKLNRSKLSKLSIAALIFASTSSFATVVEFTTSQGNFKVNLHDETTPVTVANFLKYINDGDYDNTVVHRVVPEFVMQAGGFEFTGEIPLNPIASDSAIINEPVYSNVRGTIAMAKAANNENSATSQWFVNLSDNSGGAASLDTQNGGFTVFGEVIEGLENIDNVSDLFLCSNVPMPGYTTTECSDSSFVPGVENFVTIETVTIVDATVNTAATLAAVRNTSLNTTPPEPEPTPTEPSEPTKSSSGGGSMTWFSLIFAGLITLRRRFK